MPTLAAVGNAQSDPKRDITYVHSMINENKIYTMIDSGSQGKLVSLKASYHITLLNFTLSCYLPNTVFRNPLFSPTYLSHYS